MSHISFKNYLQRNKGLIYSLKKSGRTNEDIISIILVESFFRPAIARLGEYAFYIFCRIFFKKRSEIISLGRGQIQARHWKKAINLQSIMSANDSYDEIEKIWHAQEVMSLRLEKKIATHVGETRSYYLMLVKLSLEFIGSQEIQNQKIA